MESTNPMQQSVAAGDGIAGPLHPPYDRRGSSRGAGMPEPTHELMDLAPRKRGGRTITIPDWLLQLLTVACATAFALGVARAQLDGKADKREVAVVAAQLQRVLDILCAREPQPQPRACTEPATPAP